MRRCINCMRTLLGENMYCESCRRIISEGKMLVTSASNCVKSPPSESNTVQKSIEELELEKKKEEERKKLVARLLAEKEAMEDARDAEQAKQWRRSYYANKSEGFNQSSSASRSDRKADVLKTRSAVRMKPDKKNMDRLSINKRKGTINSTKKRKKKAADKLKKFFNSKDEFAVEELTSYLKEIGYGPISALKIANKLNGKFLLVSSTRMMSIKKLEINKAFADEMESAILPYVNGTVPIRDLPCFQKLPSIRCGWTDWLVYSILRKWSKKLSVGESHARLSLAVPLVAPAGQLDQSITYSDSRQQKPLALDDLSRLDELLEEIIEWDDLESE